MRADRNHEGFQFIVDGDLQPLLRRLKKGALVPARIVLCLPENKYLLRIMGNNLVMKSRLPFKKFDEFYLRVKRLNPFLEMEMADPADWHFKKSPGRTDIIV